MSSFISRLKEAIEKNNSPPHVAATPSSSQLKTSSENHPKHTINSGGNKEAEEKEEVPTWDEAYKITMQEVIEDSPLAREKLKKLEGSCERTTTKLKKLLTIAKQYQQIGNAFKEVSAQFSEELMNWDFGEIPSCKVADESLMSDVQLLGRSMLDLNDYQSMLLVQMGNVFTQPLEQFMKEEVKMLKATKKLQRNSKSKYDNSLSKYSQIKKTDVQNVTKISEVENDLENDRSQYKLSTLEYLHKLKEVHFLSKVEYIERLCAFMYAEKAYFTQGHALHAELEKPLADVSKHMTLARKVVDEENEKLKNHILNTSNDNLPHQLNNEGKKEMETVGYLFMKKGSKWERLYFGVRNGHLVRFHTNKDQDCMEISIIVNLLLCTVRAARDVERRFCFEVVSPSETYVFQGEDENDTSEWIHTIQQAIASQLNNQVSRKSRSNSVNAPSCALVEFRKNPSNLLCADCSCRAPEWVSINLGVLICIECSGIHRQLGTHISKVRSATLDSWEKEILKLMSLMGNDFSKKVFEHSLPQPSPLLPSSDRNVRESFIRAKYVEKLYILPLPSFSQTPELELHSAIKEDNINLVYHLIMSGTNVNWKDDNNHQYSALHLSVIVGSVVITELLIQNGAEINPQDEHLWTPLHHCSSLNKVECAVLLIKRGAEIDPLDADNKTPLEVAMAKLQAHCVTLLRLAKHAQREYSGNSSKEDSFMLALKDYSEEVEQLVLNTIIEENNNNNINNSDSGELNNE